MRLSQLLVPLRSLLSSANEDLLASNFSIVELVTSLSRSIVIDKVDKAESIVSGEDTIGSPLADTLGIFLHKRRNDVAKRREKLFKLLVRDSWLEIFDEHIGELSPLLLDLALPLLLTNVMSDKDLFVVQQHSINSLDGSVGSGAGRIVNEADISLENYCKIATLTQSLGSFHSRPCPPCRKGYLQRQQTCREEPAISGGKISTHFVVNSFIKVLDEDVPLTGLSKSGVSLRPHDSARSVLDERVVESLHCPFTVIGV